MQQRLRVRAGALLLLQDLAVEQLLVQVRGGVRRRELAQEHAGQLEERVGRQTLGVEHHLHRAQVRLVEVADQQAAHRVDGGGLHGLGVLDVEQEVPLPLVTAPGAHHLEGGVQERTELVEDDLDVVPVRLVECLRRVDLDGGLAVCGHCRISSEIRLCRDPHVNCGFVVVRTLTLRVLLRAANKVQQYCALFATHKSLPTDTSLIGVIDSTISYNYMYCNAFVPSREERWF